MICRNLACVNPQILNFIVAVAYNITCVANYVFTPYVHSLHVASYSLQENSQLENNI